VLLLSTGAQLREFERFNPDDPAHPNIVKKPCAIYHYNQFCHGVDKANQNSLYYNYERKGRWY